MEGYFFFAVDLDAVFFADALAAVVFAAVAFEAEALVAVLFAAAVLLAVAFAVDVLAGAAFTADALAAGFAFPSAVTVFLLSVLVFFPKTLSQFFQNWGVAPVRTIGPLMI